MSEHAQTPTLAPDAVAGAPSFQPRVAPWMLACFGPEISADRLERGDRFIEDAIELLQSGGYPRERIAALVDYVYGRPAGDPPQEVGGVMVTLAAYCLAFGLDMHEAAETEPARIWTKVDAIRAKQAAKPTGSALPVVAPPAAREPTPSTPPAEAGLARTAAGETWRDMPVAVWIWETPHPLPGSATLSHAAFHWSTGPENAERCFRQTDVTAALAARDAEVARLREALKKIADAPAWGAPDRFDVTPSEVRMLARAALSHVSDAGGGDATD